MDGESVKLRRPLFVMRKVCGDGSGDERAVRWEIVGYVLRKTRFCARPKPVVRQHDATGGERVPGGDDTRGARDGIRASAAGSSGERRRNAATSVKTRFFSAFKKRH